MGDVLHKAAIDGDFDMIKLIMNDQGNPCSSDIYGLTPLMYAGTRTQYSTCRELHLITSFC